MKEAKLISVEGPIGAGKTSLSNKLAERLNAGLIFEKVDENLFLSDFYKSKKKNGFQTQLFFLLSRYKQLIKFSLHDPFKKITVVDYLFDKDRIFAYINLTENEFGLYEEIYSIFKSKVPAPDLVIYLNADLETLQKRIKLRGRGFEKYITDEYLEKLNKAFNYYFLHFKEAPLVTVNTNDVDLVNSDHDLDHLIQKISSILGENLM